MMSKMDTEYSGLSFRGRLEPYLDCQERQGIMVHMRFLVLACHPFKTWKQILCWANQENFKLLTAV